MMACLFVHSCYYIDKLLFVCFILKRKMSNQTSFVIKATLNGHTSFSFPWNSFSFWLQHSHFQYLVFTNYSNFLIRHRERMESREDLNSILPYLPLVMRSSTLFWPSQVVEALKAMARGPLHSRVDSGELLFLAISDLRDSLSLSNHHFAPSFPQGYALFFDEVNSILFFTFTCKYSSTWKAECYFMYQIVTGFCVFHDIRTLFNFRLMFFHQNFSGFV